MSKVVSLDKLKADLATYVNATTLSNYRPAITLANGVFDILHVGHVRYLQEAKKCKGDVLDKEWIDYEFHFNILVVGINSDASVERIRGKVPLVNQDERSELIAALDCVDYVVIFDEDSPAELIRQIKPTFHAKGKDYNLDNPPEREAIEETGTRFIVCGDEKHHSSTAMKILMKGEPDGQGE